MRYALATLLVACEPVTGHELTVFAAPGLRIPPGATLSVRNETHVLDATGDAGSEIRPPSGGVVGSDVGCLTSTDGCYFKSVGGGWGVEPVEGTFVVRVWVDMANDEVFDWSAAPPMLDFLPDAEDPAGVETMPIEMGEVVAGVLEIGLANDGSDALSVD